MMGVGDFLSYIEEGTKNSKNGNKEKQKKGQLWK
jgi:hypothetical protein